MTSAPFLLSQPCIGELSARRFRWAVPAHRKLTEDLTTQVGTFALVPQIVREVKLPVIAAGGIADARGVAAAIVFDAHATSSGGKVNALVCLVRSSPATTPRRQA